jgi:hypothetical protein
MADDMISKPRARRVRLVSQGATLVLAAGAVGAVVFGLPFLGGAAPASVEYTQVQAQAQELYAGIIARRSSDEEVTEEFPVDLEMVQEALASIQNAPKDRAAETETEEGGEDEGGDETPVAAAGKARFLGTISIGDRLLALVSAGGGQRVMGPGDKATLALADGDSGSPPVVTVRSVTVDEVVLDEDGTERRVERAPRSGVAVTTSTAPVVSSVSPNKREAAAAAAGGGRETEQIPPVNPDDFRREDGTIDYEALREAARERARQRQALRRQQREEQGDEN